MTLNQKVMLAAALAFSLILPACMADSTVAPEEQQPAPYTTDVSTAQAVLQRSATTAVPTSKLLSSATPTPAALSAQPANTPVIDETKAVCNDEWCSFDDKFILAYPIQSTPQHNIDRSYTYGSTQGRNRESHHGVEFPFAYGTPVLAAADGRVIVAGNDTKKAVGLYPGFYGNLIIIEHQIGENQKRYFSLYAHLSEILVKENTLVKAGEVIGKVGASGSAIGSHLHFEIRSGQNTYDHSVNPVLWLKPLIDHTINQQTGTLVLQNASDIDLHTQQVVIEQFGDNNIVKNVYYGETYAADIAQDPYYNEIFALSELLPGEYRLSVNYQGVVLKQLFTIFPGKLTLLPLKGPQ